MQFGLLVPTLMESEPATLQLLQQAAALGETHQFEALWVGDHLLYRVPILDATVALSTLVAYTSTIHVGTNVLQLPLRRPLDVAKSFATLSYLSSGRAILGVGVGGEFEPEWIAAGVDPRRRGARCDEAIDALHWYWDGAEKQGEFAVSPGVAVDPRPVGGRVPIWVGGRSDAAVRRAARCDGSLNMFVSVDRFVSIREQISELRHGDIDGFRFGLEIMARIDDDGERARRELRDALGRLDLDPDIISKYNAAGTPEEVAQFVSTYGDAGVDHISFYLPGPRWLDQVHRLVDDVLPRLRDRGLSR